MVSSTLIHHVELIISMAIGYYGIAQARPLRTW